MKRSVTLPAALAAALLLVGCASSSSTGTSAIGPSGSNPPGSGAPSSTPTQGTASPPITPPGTSPHTPPKGGNQVTVTKDVTYGEAAGQTLKLDAYTPKNTDTARPAVVIVHGGAWKTGSKNDFAPEGNQLAAAGFEAFAIDYRLLPQFPYPAAVDDAQTAVRWVRTHAKDYGVDPARIGALGGSAGAHLVGLLGTLGEGPLDRDARVAAVVSWSGPMDFNADGVDKVVLDGANTAGMVPQFLGCPKSACPDTYTAASPISHLDPSDAPMLLANSDHELVPEGQANEMGDALAKVGIDHKVVILPGTKHSRAYAPQIWGDTLAWFQSHL